MKASGIESAKARGQDRLDGAAPPWGAYGEANSTYERNLMAQTGSGLLGGWCYMAAGGYVGVASRARAEAEAWEEYRRCCHRPAWAQLPPAPHHTSEVHTSHRMLPS